MTLDILCIALLAMPLYAFFYYIAYDTSNVADAMRTLASKYNGTKVSSWHQLIEELRSQGLLETCISFIAKYLSIQICMFTMIISFVIFCWVKYGATPGKKLLRCRLINKNTGLNLSVKRSVLRVAAFCVATILGIVISIFLIVTLKKYFWDQSKIVMGLSLLVLLSPISLSFIVARFTKYRQTLYDLAAHSVVVIKK